MRRHPLLAGCLALMVPVLAAQETPPTYTDIAPILKNRCVICHAGLAAPLGLRLDSLASLRAGSDNGSVVRSGDPAASPLVQRIRGTRQPRMPLTGPPYLDEVEMALIEAWIAGGLNEGPAAEPAVAPAAPPVAGDPVRYPDVAPIFLQRCVKCHTDQGLHGGPPQGLRLKSRELILAGGERAVVVPGVPGASELVRRITGQSRPRMPLDGPPYLSEEEIRLLRDWVAQGAVDADGNRAAVPAGAEVRLQGTLSGFWALDGLPLVVDRNTRLKKSPALGDRVRVHATVLPDGRLRATRIRPR